MSETLPRPTPLVQAPVQVPVNPGTSSLDFRDGKQVYFAMYAYVPVPPIPHLAAHTQVEWRVDTGKSSGPAGFQVDWVQATVWVRRGTDANGTWMTTKELRAAKAGNDSVLERRLVGKPTLIDLLRHEQGHYDITALLVRDQFNEVMALIRPKRKVFPTERDLQIALQDLQTQTKALEATLRGNYVPGLEYPGLYDEETRHGQDKVKQEEWNVILRMAWGGRPLREILKIRKKKI